ncbi:hypothetical protein KFK09_003111 [Dendrobium nobile]|uniref:Uncharacterized protein n=1 Tax=Dendrobium nobile TaxID=94219 RepID=A0A8T3C5L8_DENNO|nr:hypothetical protein KFK09_003111 [Dendrobium nobile]
MDVCFHNCLDASCSLFRIKPSFKLQNNCLNLKKKKTFRLRNESSKGGSHSSRTTHEARSNKYSG